MATKQTDDCLRKAADDEPIFVLRAKDALAPEIVEEWANRAEHRGVPEPKVAEARHLAVTMRTWQVAHGAKIPD